jgi:hypothetical protein
MLGRRLLQWVLMFAAGAAGVLAASSVLAGAFAASPDNCMSGNIVDRLCKVGMHRDPEQIVAAPVSSDVETIQPLEPVSEGAKTVSDAKGSVPDTDTTPTQSEVNTSSGAQTAEGDDLSSPSTASSVPSSRSSTKTDITTTINTATTTTTDTPPGYIEHPANTGNLITADGKVYNGTGTPTTENHGSPQGAGAQSPAPNP